MEKMAALHQSVPAGDGLQNYLRNGLKNLERDLGEESERGPAAVHRLRRRIKSLRALVRMIRVAIGDEAFGKGNDALRQAGRALAPARRMGAMVESAEKLKADGLGRADLAVVRDLARAASRLAEEGLSPELFERAAGDARHHIAGLRSVANRWQLPQCEMPVFVEGMTRVYARARRLVEKGLASADPAILHEARKSVIHLRYQLDMLEPIWPALIAAWVKELQRLREVLGDFNDLCEMESLINDPASPLFKVKNRSAALRLVNDRRNALLARGCPLARRLFAEPPSSFATRMTAMWEAWYGGREAPPLLPSPRAYREKVPRRGPH
jgi:CHAD domain-containing protein